MNPVTWFSIPADDLDRAVEFYKDVFGWDIQAETVEQDPLYNYRVALNSESDEEATPNAPGTVNGCLVHREIGLAHPAVLVEVEDLDKAVEAAVAAGGKRLTPEVPMRSLAGRFVLVEDTEGNPIELFMNDR